MIFFKQHFKIYTLLHWAYTESHTKRKQNTLLIACLCLQPFCPTTLKITTFFYSHSAMHLENATWQLIKLEHTMGGSTWC